MSQSRKNVMLLSLDNYKNFSHLHDYALDDLETRRNLIHVQSVDEALTVLRQGGLASILVYEPSIIAKHKDAGVANLVNLLVDFVKEGGTMVFAFNCCGRARLDHVDSFFSDVWQLPWKVNSYHGEAFQKNPSSVLPGLGNLGQHYDTKAVNLGNVANEHLVYLAYDTGPYEAKPRMPDRDRVINEGPIVFAPFGLGNLGWIGDVNRFDESHAAILAMCGLN